MSKRKADQARKRAEMILKVRSGQITATEAARLLGISRKTYYQWEARALQGMLESLVEKEPGRPTKPEPDREKERLEKKVAELEQKLETMAEVYDLRGLLSDLNRKDPPPKTPARRRPKKKP
jgi:DNA-binding XRE family transcriptional regulator